MHAPTIDHWQAVKHILRYLKGTITHGLHFQVGSFLLSLFQWWLGWQSRWSSSTSGYCDNMGPNLISWSAKKQSTLARSSTKAEYRSLAHTTAELCWVRSLFRDFGIFLHHSPLIWCHNISALRLASNPIFHVRKKHIEIDYHFVREKVTRCDLDVRYVACVDQVDDIFTKGLSSVRFKYLKSKLHSDAPPLILKGHIDQPLQQSRQCQFHIFLDFHPS